MAFAGMLIIGPRPVEGNSMEPSYHDGQRVMVIKALKKPERGQVVVAWLPERKELLIKRVIGIPGDTVRIEPDGSVTVNGALSDYGIGNSYVTPYISGMDLTEDGAMQVLLQKGEYFLLGDNREDSADSRVFGPFKRSQIIELVLSK